MKLLDTLKGATATVTHKVGETVEKHGDKIETGIDKAAEFVDDKTKGKYHDKIESATGKAKGALGVEGASDHDEEGPGEGPQGSADK